MSYTEEYHRRRMIEETVRRDLADRAMNRRHEERLNKQRRRREFREYHPWLAFLRWGPGGPR